ncbi:putative Mn2+/Fe2+ ABC transporter, ATP-binding protein [Campylobacter iguaniorum]|uniref:metal ABC transporter ATP-binding protein n=1 Tax=Campylobacter iguaniorum TaxID=1244531 RepID=UPI0007C8888A|nr:metal ABC transporter ATP-binding protein [Campylobacter iguaniorum]ANE35781.1 putative Mn2+/Fe2+ ABC transporter, ATP-binding protein [Campylobacter iguaniorum]
MKKISLEVSNLSVKYANVVALEDVNFSLEGGNVCALIGTNGSGKSTLFKSIMGVIKPKGCEIKICGFSLKDAIKQSLIAYVPQNEEIDFDFPINVWELVMMGRFAHMGFFKRPKFNDIQVVTEALKKVDMYELRHRQIGELSGGQKKRIFIARSLASGAKVILLDEPFNGVDAKTESMILDLLIKLRADGYLILVSTHNLGMAAQYCNRAILLKKTVLASGFTNDVLTPSNLTKVFGGSLRYFKVEVDDTSCNIALISDDEKPLIVVDEKVQDGMVNRAF